MAYKKKSMYDYSKHVFLINRIRSQTRKYTLGFIIIKQITDNINSLVAIYIIIAINYIAAFFKYIFVEINIIKIYKDEQF